jgi:hypothetical protein
LYHILLSSVSGSDTKTDTPKLKPKYDSHAPDAFKTPEEKKEELMDRWTGAMTEQKGPMPQDLTEGCGSDEWVLLLSPKSECKKYW